MSAMNMSAIEKMSGAALDDDDDDVALAAAFQRLAPRAVEGEAVWRETDEDDSARRLMSNTESDEHDDDDEAWIVNASD